WTEFFPRVAIWWSGNYVAILVVPPLVVAWKDILRAKIPPLRWLEGTALLILLSVTVHLIFGGFIPLSSNHYPLEYLCIPYLIWAALRLEQKGVTAAVLVISLLPISGRHQGLGPFFQENTFESLILVQLFVATAAILSLVLTSLLSERESSQRLLSNRN